MKKIFIVITGLYLLFLTLIGILIVILSFFNINPQTVFSTNERIQLLIVWIPLIGWLITTGIGLFLKKNWARYSILVMSVFAISMGLIGCLGVHLLSLTELSLDELTVPIIRIFILVPSLLFLIILPIIYLIFFNKRSVKEIFEKDSSAVSYLKRPLGISILAFSSLFNVINMISLAFFPTVNIFPLFGFLLSGIAITIHNLIRAMSSIYIAYGFWKLKKTAWFAAIILSCVNILSGVLNFIFINVNNYYQMTSRNNVYPSFSSALLKYGFLYGSVIASVVLIYIISRKSAFFTDKPASNRALDVEQ